MHSQLHPALCVAEPDRACSEVTESTPQCTAMPPLGMTAWGAPGSGPEHTESNTQYI